MQLVWELGVIWPDKREQTGAIRRWYAVSGGHTICEDAGSWRAKYATLLFTKGGCLFLDCFRWRGEIGVDVLFWKCDVLKIGTYERLIFVFWHGVMGFTCGFD